jgi:hypothetical protein
MRNNEMRRGKRRKRKRKRAVGMLNDCEGVATMLTAAMTTLMRG